VTIIGDRTPYSRYISNKNRFSMLNSRLGATIEDLGILDRLLKNGYDRRATPTNHLSKLIKKSPLFAERILWRKKEISISKALLLL